MMARFTKMSVLALVGYHWIDLSRFEASSKATGVERRVNVTHAFLHEVLPPSAWLGLFRF